jgi:hypothetical protein
MKYKIYKLIYNGEVVYVGKTTQTLEDRKHGGYGKNPELQKIYKKCDIVEIEKTNDVSREQYWIDEFSKSYNLLNKRKGDIGLSKLESIKYHNDKAKDYRKDYYDKNKELILEKTKEYREKNKEKIKEYMKNYYQNKTKNKI